MPDLPLLSPPRPRRRGSDVIGRRRSATLPHGTNHHHDDDDGKDENDKDGGGGDDNDDNDDNYNEDLSQSPDEAPSDVAFDLTDLLRCAEETEKEFRQMCQECSLPLPLSLPLSLSSPATAMPTAALLLEHRVRVLQLPRLAVVRRRRRRRDGDEQRGEEDEEEAEGDEEGTKQKVDEEDVKQEEKKEEEKEAEEEEEVEEVEEHVDPYVIVAASAHMMTCVAQLVTVNVVVSSSDADADADADANREKGDKDNGDSGDNGGGSGANGHGATSTYDCADPMRIWTTTAPSTSSPTSDSVADAAVTAAPETIACLALLPSPPGVGVGDDDDDEDDDDSDDSDDNSHDDEKSTDSNSNPMTDKIRESGQSSLSSLSSSSSSSCVVVVGTSLGRVLTFELDLAPISTVDSDTANTCNVAHKYKLQSRTLDKVPEPFEPLLPVRHVPMVEYATATATATTDPSVPSYSHMENEMVADASGSTMTITSAAATMASTAPPSLSSSLHGYSSATTTTEERRTSSSSVASTSTNNQGGEGTKKTEECDGEKEDKNAQIEGKGGGGGSFGLIGGILSATGAVGGSGGGGGGAMRRSSSLENLRTAAASAALLSAFRKPRRSASPANSGSGSVTSYFSSASKRKEARIPPSVKEMVPEDGGGDRGEGVGRKGRVGGRKLFGRASDKGEEKEQEEEEETMSRGSVVAIAPHYRRHGDDDECYGSLDDESDDNEYNDEEGRNRGRLNTAPDSLGNDRCQVWITFSNGSSVRLPRWALFASIRMGRFAGGQGASGRRRRRRRRRRAPNLPPSVELVWCHVPPAVLGGGTVEGKMSTLATSSLSSSSSGVFVVPLPVHYPSPFEPIGKQVGTRGALEIGSGSGGGGDARGKGEGGDNEEEGDDDDDGFQVVHPDEYHDAIAFGFIGGTDAPFSLSCSSSSSSSPACLVGGGGLGAPSLVFLAGSRISSTSHNDDDAAAGVSRSRSRKRLTMGESIHASSARSILMGTIESAASDAKKEQQKEEEEEGGGRAGAMNSAPSSVTGYHVRERMISGLQGVWGYVYGTTDTRRGGAEEEGGGGGEISTATGGEGGVGGGGDGASALGSAASDVLRRRLPPTLCSSHARLAPVKPLYDPPRRVTYASVSPCGSYAALADALGRVQLLDLSTRSVIRMWKGAREARCEWSELRNMAAKRHGGHGRKGGIGGGRDYLYLVIHTRTRDVAEAYRIRHGPKVGSWAVSGRGGAIVGGWEVERSSVRRRGTKKKGGPSRGRGAGKMGGAAGSRPPLARCFALRLSGGDGTGAMLESLRIADGEVATVVPPASAPSLPIEKGGGTAECAGEAPLTPSRAARSRTPASGGAARLRKPRPLASSGAGADLYLQILKQMLSSDTAVQSTPSAVFDALTRVGSLSDLAFALDLLGKSDALDEEMRVKGGRSEFHAMCVKHVESRLAEVLERERGGVEEGSDAIRRVRDKIEYHGKVVSAYQVLRKFEIRTNASGGPDDDDDDGGGSEFAGENPWKNEATSWLDTFEAVTGRGLDDYLPLGATDAPEPIKFARFVRCCEPELSSVRGASGVDEADGSEDGTESRGVYLCDSTRDRRSVLVHLFRPLTADIFAFRVTGDIFIKLGISKDRGTMQRYFGEWFMSLPARSASKLSLTGSWRPPVRWLQEMVGALIDDEFSSSEPTAKSEDGAPDRDDFDPKDAEEFLCLRDLHDFCADADDLPRAFLLAAACREAVSTEAAKKEEKTYGRVMRKDAVDPWDRLLRRIRVCLLITLRLHGAPLGQFPVTVSHVSKGEVFSVYEWVARDELSISHNHDEIVTLEDTCRMCRQAFDPSSPVGDDPRHVRTLQRVCRVAGRGERAARFFMADNDQPGPLLLYLGSYNHPVRLAAHRALVLGGMWSEQPELMHMLKDAVSALRSLEAEGGRYLSTAAAVRLELWQVCIRPIYRAIFFGFHDVPELREELVGPLCMEPGWLYDLSRIALDVLALIARTVERPGFDDSSSCLGGPTRYLVSQVDPFEEYYDTEAPWRNEWPVTDGDVLLDIYEARARPVIMSSLEAHRAIVTASQLTDDFSTLAYCVPSFEDMFHRHSLFGEVPVPSSFSEYQVEFLNRAVVRKALLAAGPIVDRFVLEGVENLGRSWGVDLTQTRARFLLAMYDVGKDDMVTDDLVDMSPRQLDYSLFIEGGIEIACVRLYDAIATLRRIKTHRGIVTMLDADTCKWVREQAKTAEAKRSAAGDNFEEEFEPVPLSSTHALTLRILKMCSAIDDTESSEKAHALSILSGTLISALEENPLEEEEEE